jgi:hypothetical protein
MCFKSRMYIKFINETLHNIQIRVRFCPSLYMGRMLNQKCREGERTIISQNERAVLIFASLTLCLKVTSPAGSIQQRKLITTAYKSYPSIFMFQTFN